MGSLFDGKETKAKEKKMILLDYIFDFFLFLSLFVFVFTALYALIDLTCLFGLVLNCGHCIFATFYLSSLVCCFALVVNYPNYG